jgi:isopentenyldiphosphate isomerase
VPAACPTAVPYILVFNSWGDIFLHLRTPTKDVYPGHWDVAVGGVLAAGESFADGARRELQEELGVEAPLEELFPFRYADARTVVHAVVYKAVHDGPFRLQKEEIVRGEFVAVEEFKERASREPFCPDGLEAFAEYERRGQI